MPTGYTSKIYEGKEQTGKEFLMTCARAFGATIEMRDMGLDAEIPEEFQPSTYHQEQINIARENLLKYTEMTIEEASELAEMEYNQKLIDNKKYNDKKFALRDRYQNTLGEVLNWEPPTSEHEGLKKFAIEQLQESIKWDCTIYPRENYKKETPQEYIERKIGESLKDIEYYQKKWEEEVKRTNACNLWIKQLRESLK